jgi:hypothetical protein
MAPRECAKGLLVAARNAGHECLVGRFVALLVHCWEMAAIRTIPPSVVRAMRNKRAGRQKPAVSNSGDKCRRTAKFR